MECELAAADVAEAEDHLSVCEHCRAALDRAIGHAEWWQEARESLSHGAGERPVAGDARSAHSDLLALLGPTDDPHMLGRIGAYEITGILGRGGMGVVFKGFDGALNRYVAIKMLAPHLAASGGARKRFAREAQAAAAVIHDNVMAIHAVAEWQGVPYLVMPYGRGVSLQRRLSDEGPLEVREILRVGMQTAQALAAAHAQGLVHRDVKPANILLGQC
jgi:serine/threonine protein kinase